MKNRRGDRQGLRWGDVDLETDLVELHDSKAGRQTRVLGAAAVELLQAAKSDDAGDCDCVCPWTVPGQPFIGIDKARRALWKAAGLEGVDLHSLRHTFASVGAHVEEGRYVGMVAPLLGHGHQSRAITERYITSNPEAPRPAAEAIVGGVGGVAGRELVLLGSFVLLAGRELNSGLDGGFFDLAEGGPTAFVEK